MRRLHGLQYLRGTAATAVVMFHAAGKAGLDFHIGEAGVDLFFVLSGFLMVAITSEETRATSFIADRFRRVAPPYWIATTVVLIGAMVGLFPAMRLANWHVASSYLFIPSVSPSNGQVWPLLVPGWTLNFEMMFYLLFAASVALVPYRLRVPLVTAILVALVLTGIAFQPDDPVAASLTNPIMLEFAAGAWLGLLWKRPGEWPERIGWPLILLGAALMLGASTQRNEDIRVILFGLPAVLLVAGTLALERRGAGVAERPLALLLGDASYSIYLWHTLVISAIAKLVLVAGLPPSVIVVAGTAAGVGAGIAAYLFIERPLLRAMKKCSARPPTPLAATS